MLWGASLLLYHSLFHVIFLEKTAVHEIVQGIYNFQDSWYIFCSCPQFSLENVSVWNMPSGLNTLSQSYLSSKLFFKHEFTYGSLNLPCAFSVSLCYVIISYPSKSNSQLLLFWGKLSYSHSNINLPSPVLPLQLPQIIKQLSHCTSYCLSVNSCLSAWLRW